MSIDSPSPDAPRSRSRLGRLDRRVVGICVCIALIAALGAGLLTSVLTSGDSESDDSTSSGSISLTPRPKVDAAKVLRTPLLTFDGKATTLAERVGDRRPTVVNFFSTTCTPCIKEMPAFERVHRSRDDISFIGIDVQDQVGPGRKLIERTGITYEALRDPPGDLLRIAGGVGLPTTLLIDAEGRVVESHTGALTERTLRTLIRSKLS